MIPGQFGTVGFDPLDLSGQREKAEAAGEKARLEADQAAADLKAVMADPAGRRFVWRLLELAGIYRASFAGESTHATAFNEGQRSGGLRMLSEIFSACPGSYELMVKEANERRTKQHRSEPGTDQPASGG
jgi:hypothetical protein